MSDFEKIELDQELKQEKTNCPKYTFLKILVAVLYLALLALILTHMIPIITTPKGVDKAIKLTFFLVFVLIIFGVPLTIATTIPAVIGLLKTLKKRKKGEKRGQVAYFAIFTLLPVLTEILAYIVCLII